MNYSLVILLSYLIGSIPNGLLIGKWLKNVDLREYGSKNIGATNAYRVLGLGPALGVFITDALKGVIGVYLGSAIVGEPFALLLGGIAAMAGHNWSLFLKFKGGRGVSTGLGVIAMIVPKVTVIIFIIWALIFYFTRYVSLASIIAAGLVPIMMYLLGEKNEFLYFGVLAAAFVIIRHKANIIRLLHGEELKIK
jgi:glycerol-3-phosphate acyltransferase PlsY